MISISPSGYAGDTTVPSAKSAVPALQATRSATQNCIGVSGSDIRKDEVDFRETTHFCRATRNLSGGTGEAIARPLQPDVLYQKTQLI
jgi:hypothetical protein